MTSFDHQSYYITVPIYWNESLQPLTSRMVTNRL